MTGLATSSTRDILEYLYQTYGLVTPALLTTNGKRFKAPYNGSTFLEAYFNGIEDCFFMAYKAYQSHNPSVSPSPCDNGINSRP